MDTLRSLYRPCIITYYQPTPLASNGVVAVFFVENNSSVEFKPRQLNIVADALSSRLNFDPDAQPKSAATSVVALTSSVHFKYFWNTYAKCICVIHSS